MEKIKCSHTGKTKFKSPGEAKTTMLNLKSISRIYSFSGKRVNRRSKKVKQCRYYYCVHCNGYHLTSDKAPLKKNKRQKLYLKRVNTTKDFFKTQNEGNEWKKDSLPFPILNNKNI